MKAQLFNRNLGCHFVFHRNGQKIVDFRHAWNKACRDAGLGFGYRISLKYVEKWESELNPGPTIRDFRRTAFHNLVRSDMYKNVAMKIEAHIFKGADSDLA